jgi:hypothetical protein
MGGLLERDRCKESSLHKRAPTHTHMFSLARCALLHSHILSSDDAKRRGTIITFPQPQLQIKAEVRTRTLAYYVARGCSLASYYLCR